MPFSNDTELVAAIQKTLHRENDPDITDDQVYDWIRLTEIAVSRKVDLRDSDLVTDVTFTSGEIAYTIPNNWHSIRQVTLDQGGSGQDHLELISIHSVAQEKKRYASPGAAVYGYVHGNTLRTVPELAVDTPGKIFYTASDVDLKSTNTNWLLEAAPDVYFYGALTHSAPFIGEDERLPIWNSLFTSAMESLEQELWNWRFGLLQGRSRPDIGTPSGTILRRQTR